MGLLLLEQLEQWKSGSGIMRLWQDACNREAKFVDFAVSEEALAKDNIWWALQWASHGCYGNALQALDSTRACIASFQDAKVKEEYYP